MAHALPFLVRRAVVPVALVRPAIVAGSRRACFDDGDKPQPVVKRSLTTGFFDEVLMLDWFKNLFTSGKTVIYIDNVTFPICGCCPKPKPTAPAVPVLSPGDSFMAIKFPVSVPAGASDVVTTTVVYQEDGSPSATVAIAGNGGDTFITVAEGSNGSVWANYADKTGNLSADSPKATWTNASDTVPPAAPAGAPTISAGDTV